MEAFVGGSGVGGRFGSGCSSSSTRRRRYSCNRRVVEADGDARIALEIHREILLGLASQMADRMQDVVKDAATNLTRNGILQNPSSTSTKTTRNHDVTRSSKLYPPERIADPDAFFVKAGEPQMSLHCKVHNPSQPQKRLHSFDGLMLHGLLGSTFTYRRVQQLVADSLNGQVVSFDMPGFGLTERPNPLLWKLFGAKESPYSFRHASALTAQVIDACRLKRTVLFGHSLGGSVALDAVLNGAPVDALVLFSPAAKIPSVPRFLKRMINSVLSTPVVGNIAVRRSVHRMVELEIEEMVRRNFHDLSRISMEETVAGYTAPMKVHNWDTALRDFSIHFDGFNFLDDERLQALTIPTLIIAGEQDRILSVDDMTELSKQIPSAMIQVISDCGHIPQEELPHETMAIIDHWLERYVPSPPL